MYSKPKTKSYSVTKMDINTLPFYEISESVKDAGVSKTAVIDSWAETYGIKFHNWVYPQILAHVGKWTPVRTDLGPFDPVETLKQACQNNPQNTGIYLFTQSNSRYLQKQACLEGAPYCGLVPLVLAAFKKYQDISYNSWSREGLKYIVNPGLYEAMTEEVPEYTLEELLEFRSTGLTTKSGARAGTVRSAQTTYGLNGLPYHLHRDDDLIKGPGQLSQISRMIICQTWCAHPSWRNKYMILNHQDWDSIPDPLVLEDPVKETFENTTKPSKNSFPDLPWL